MKAAPRMIASLIAFGLFNEASRASPIVPVGKRLVGPGSAAFAPTPTIERLAASKIGSCSLG